MNKIKLYDTFTRYRISQLFGKTDFAIKNPSYYPQGGHTGIDYAIQEGWPIYATHKGIIVQDDDANRSAKGIYIVILDMEQRVATHYYHLRSNVVSIGDHVYAGKIIGISGQTGLSTGPHLHFGLCMVDADGMRINRDNGFNGFIDPLSPALVQWEHLP